MNDPTLRIAARVIQAAAFAVVLAALPYPLFELDRYTFPKELVLVAGALAATLLCLASARRLTVFVVDALLAGFLAVSALSALFATNGWLAFRALGVSLAGAALFWCARTVARAGRGEAVLVGLGRRGRARRGHRAGPGLRLVDTNLASLSRAPGGTFGNRNFMAHLVDHRPSGAAVRGARGALAHALRLGAAGVALAAAALVLSRSRAAWLGAGACAVFLAVEGLWVGRLWAERAAPAARAAAGLGGGWRAWCWRWCCRTGSTGARIRPISSRSPAWPTTRKAAGGAG